MKKSAVFGAFLALSVSAPVVARPVDNSGSPTSEALARMAPRDGGIQIELAADYVRAGRMTDAAAAYRRVLNLDNVMLETPRGQAIWSHEVARRGLAGITQMTSL